MHNFRFQTSARVLQTELNQRTNGPENAHLIFWPCGSTTHTKRASLKTAEKSLILATHSPSFNHLVYYIRGMIKNNVDFCYKKLYSRYRLIQTITGPFRFGNCLGSEKMIFVLILFIPLVHGLFLLPWSRASGAVQ